jgi:hypothetical protein
MGALRGCLAAVPLLVAVSAHAQSLRPMTAVRITTGDIRQTARVVRADSTSLTLENSAGERRTIARADITAIERRAGNAKRGAQILGGIGVGVGAGFGALLVAAFCETGDCGDEVLPAMLYVAGAFGTIGAVGGAAIGHYAGGWHALDQDVRVLPTDPVATCLLRPRIETQFLGDNEQSGSHRRLFNLGAVCESGTVIGFEFGNVAAVRAETVRETADPQFGMVVTTLSTSRQVSFRGIFVEQPLTTGRVRLSAIGSYGEYHTEARRFESSYLEEYLADPDYAAFHRAYPFTSTFLGTRDRAANVGAKAALALGTSFSAGVAVRLQRAGTDGQKVESAVTLSFRP